MPQELPSIEKFDIKDKILLVRVDHNVVSKGAMKDTFRVEATYGLIHYISRMGAFPILMTHVGRPLDKKTGHITASEDTSIQPIVNFLNRKLEAGLVVPDLPIHPEKGIEGIDFAIMEPLLKQLKERKIGGIYLPNTRWFSGEESDDEKTEKLASDLAQLADIYVNDAFGSWQAHASTYDIAKKMPLKAAGFLMRKELKGLEAVLSKQKHPFLAVVAGSKFDTKIKPLMQLHDKVDHLLLGGTIYNAYLCAKYGITIMGVDDEDVKVAKGLVEKDKGIGKIVEPEFLVESDFFDERSPGNYRTVKAGDFKKGNSYKYFLDVAPESFDSEHVNNIIQNAKTIFVNAVMGFTPNFFRGTKKMFEQIDLNKKAQKLYGGGDTINELKDLLPGMFLEAIDDPKYYLFTGGGAVLTAIEKNSPFGIKPVEVLMEK